VAVCGILASGMTSKAPIFLYPFTSSPLPGLYIRSFESPTVGAILAFPAPQAARRYKASIGEEVREEFLFMKPVIAGPGDHVCHRPENGIYVNDLGIAPAAMHDRTGRSLPPMAGCRHMAKDEFFTLSTDAPISFDSRKFGPIRSSQTLGTYLSLMEFPRPSRNSTS
jgi:type IV secretory pathway protease TraF